MNYYNEFDPVAAERLRLLMDAGLIPQGIVDTRSIVDVKPEDLRGFTQCHFFAGIGGWPLALQLAGIPDAFPLWTGSPPCQPFSVAGAGLGRDDSRHLAPAFLNLVAECRPPVIFGEQVAAAIKKHHWLDALLIELEEEGYTCGAHVLPAAGVGAPHKRDRLFFGAVQLDDTESFRRSTGRDGHYAWDVGKFTRAAGEDDKLVYTEDWRQQRVAGELADPQAEGVRNLPGQGDRDAIGGCAGPDDELADVRVQRRSDSERSRRDVVVPGGRVEEAEAPAGCGSDGDMADVQRDGSQGRLSGWQDPQRQTFGGQAGCSRPVGYAGLSDSHHPGWDDVDWLYCRDERFRPVEPGTFPLANGVPGRVGLLKGYGNAIVPQVAARFVSNFILAAGETGRGDI